MTEIKKINGRLTKREILRRIYGRAISEATSDVYNKKYVARRVGVSVERCEQMLRWMSANMNLGVEVEASNFVFIR
jgi:hypothetical protein